MFFSRVFYTKFVDNKGEGNQLGIVLSETRGADTLIISMWCKEFAK